MDYEYNWKEIKRLIVNSNYDLFNVKNDLIPENRAAFDMAYGILLTIMNFIENENDSYEKMWNDLKNFMQQEKNKYFSSDNMSVNIQIFIMSNLLKRIDKLNDEQKRIPLHDIDHCIYFPYVRNQNDNEKSIIDCEDCDDPLCENYCE